MTNLEARPACRAALLPQHGPMTSDLLRWADVWEKMAGQCKGDLKRLEESRELIARIDKRLSV